MVYWANSVKHTSMKSLLMHTRSGNWHIKNVCGWEGGREGWGSVQHLNHKILILDKIKSLIHVQLHIQIFRFSNIIKIWTFTFWITYQTTSNISNLQEKQGWLLRGMDNWIKVRTNENTNHVYSSRQAKLVILSRFKRSNK